MACYESCSTGKGGGISVDFQHIVAEIPKQHLHAITNANCLRKPLLLNTIICLYNFQINLTVTY